jgi:Na+/citrate or Na+/malate symporter
LSAISAALEKKKTKMANNLKVQSTLTALFQVGKAVATTKAILGTTVLSMTMPPPMLNNKLLESEVLNCVAMPDSVA